MIERFPPEILDRICEDLKTRDIRSLRLVSRFCSNVATPWLINSFGLRFTLSSFRRLNEISRHPVISLWITSIVYVPNVFIDSQGKRYYDQCVEDIDANGLPQSFEEKQDVDVAVHNNGDPADDCENSEEEKALDAIGSDLPDAHVKNRAWYVRQWKLCRQDYGYRLLMESMRRLPNLINIDMWEDDTGLTLSENISIPNAPKRYSHYSPFKVPQAHLLLEAANEAGVALERLELGWIYWDFLQKPEDVWQRMAGALTNLWSFGCRLASSPVEVNSDDHPNRPRCRQLVQRGRVYDVIAKASSLESLAISCDLYIFTCPPDLKDAVRSAKWCNLRNVDLGCLEAAAGVLLAFFNRHAATLRTLRLQRILLSSGEWTKTLEVMQKGLNLLHVDIDGSLRGADPEQYWDCNPFEMHYEPEDFQAVKDQAVRTKSAIENYLIHGGSCPLFDQEAYPQTLLH